VGVAGDSGSAVTLEFAISDTGIGIPKDRAEDLFAPFVQADASTTRKYGGIGLGLAICKHLVELMGGRIGFASEEGRGSTFHFTAVFEKQTTSVPVAGHPCGLAGVKVLLVDDSASNRQVLTTLLTNWGCRSSEAADEAAALSLLRQAAQDGEPFAIALVDVGLPGANGNEVAGRIAADARLPETRLLLMVPVGEQVADAGSQASSFSFRRVSKPIVDARLRQALAEVLSAEAVPPPAAVEPPMPAPCPKPERSQARILVAEDHPVNREVLLAMLRRLGHGADSVENGALAIEALRSFAYDLVLMDCEMPEVDGYEATRAIRNPATGTLKPGVPVVAVTANAMPGDREKCFQCGMVDYLSKPIEMGALARLLAKWIGPAQPVEKHDTPPPADSARCDSVFDEAGLLKRLGGNQALARRLMSVFLDDTPSQLSLLRKHVEEGDAPSARRQAHKIKGASATLSVGALRDVAYRAEQAAMAGQLTTVAELLPAMEGEFARVRIALQPPA